MLSRTLSFDSDTTLLELAVAMASPGCEIRKEEEEEEEEEDKRQKPKNQMN